MTELLKGRALVTAGMRHAAHLSPEMIAEARDKTPPHLRAAVIDGDPTMGSGNVYTVARADIEFDYVRNTMGKYIDVPAHWKLIGGLDVGHNQTAFVKLAHDTDTDTVYVVDEFGAQHQPPAVIRAAMKARKADKYPTMIDPASQGSSQIDGRKLIIEYRGVHGDRLDIRPADNAVEAGIAACWNRFSTGRLKIFKHCVKTLKEYEMYQRSVDGKVVKKNDHFMDALRYAVMGLKQAKFIYQNDKSDDKWEHPYRF